MENSKQLFEFFPIEFFQEGTIRFKKVPEPLVSIIIPVYNQILYTLNCLYSLQNTCKDIAVEIIVVNDNSSDETLNYLSEIEGVIVINNEKNLGFLKNVNNGIHKATGEFVLLLNNDVVVLEDFLTELLYVFDKMPDAGAVGAMAIHPTGLLWEAGSMIFNDGSAANIGRECLPNNPRYNYLKTVDYCSGYCLIFKRILPDGTLAQLDELFLPAYYEETDFCMQLQYDFGLKIYYQPFAKVIHFESISYGKEKNGKKEQLINTNYQKFLQKWNNVLMSPKFISPPKKTIHLKDEFLNMHYTGECYLFVEDVIDNSVLDSIKVLNNNGHKIYVLLNNDEDMELVESLRREGVEVLYPYLNQKNEAVTTLGTIWRLSPIVHVLETNILWYRLIYKFSKLFGR